MDELAQKVAKRFAGRVVPIRLDSSRRSRINRDLEQHGFGGRRKFRSVGEAINVATGVLQKHGLELDEIPNAWFFREPSGHKSLDMAWSNPQDPFSPVPISNSMLALQWTELREGVFEVIGYMS